MKTNDPYEVFGLERHADAETIRRRYLELVREHSPEKSPEKFSEIRRAYDLLRDPVEGLARQLFNDRSEDSFEGLIAELQGDVRDQRLPTELLLSLARS